MNDAFKIIKTFCLKPISTKEFYNGDSKAERGFERQDDEVISNIRNCNGNPEALMMLAFFLRFKSMDEIDVVVKKAPS